MPTSATEQGGQEIPLGLPRADALETSVNVPASPASRPLEGRVLTFSSPVSVVVVTVSLEESNVVGITPALGWDRLRKGLISEKNFRIRN